MTDIDRSPAITLSFRQHLRDCTLCDLRTGCTAPVPWYGDQDVEVAVIGEAPGKTEDVEGRPFIGSAGTRLRYLLNKGGIDPGATTYLNSVQCYPARGLDPRDDRHYIDTCRQWMRGQIAFIRPQYVITVGVVAYYSVFGLTWPKLSMVRGKPLYWDDPPVPAKPVAVWCTWHPAAALRSTARQKDIEGDLVAFKEWRAGGEVWPETCYICGEELYRYMGNGIAMCRRHAARQGSLWPEEVGA